MKIDEYGAIARFLHQLALGSNIVRRTSLEVDLLTNKNNCANSGVDEPVYILGLARAGTTILLEALYSTGLFASLTYRNMPFVLAPNLWSHFSTGFQKVSGLAERKHGDNLQVGYDSPEAFEEVFWLTFSNEKYIDNDRLRKHVVNDEVLYFYKKYIASFLSIKENSSCRYLAKNNNNILRISSLLKVFPNGRFIVPFRNPEDHAASLLRQHRRFVRIHRQDKFALKYMNWLGHFEFGLNYKPMEIEDGTAKKDELHSIKYWLRYWASIYDFLLKNHGDDVVFFNYDGLCENPEKAFEVLASYISIDPNLLYSFKHKIAPSNNKENVANTYQKAMDVYNQLLSKSLN
ncbi:MAG: sulfotransferase [Bacteroidales bacterium]